MLPLRYLLLKSEALVIGRNCTRNLWISTSQLWGEGVEANSVQHATVKPYKTQQLKYWTTGNKSSTGAWYFNMCSHVSIQFLFLRCCSKVRKSKEQGLWIMSGTAGISVATWLRQMQHQRGTCFVSEAVILHVVNYIYQHFTHEALATKWGCDFRMASLWWHVMNWFYSPSESGTLRFVLANELGVNGFHISFQSLPYFPSHCKLLDIRCSYCFLPQ